MILYNIIFLEIEGTELQFIEYESSSLLKVLFKIREDLVTRKKISHFKQKYR